jgi:hypothetical protein
VKIGILSDIHGNFDALRAVPETFDEIWVLVKSLGFPQDVTNDLIALLRTGALPEM